MTRVVMEHGGVNLAQGMPNWEPPPEVIAAAHAAIDGDFHQYAVTWGAPSLRRAIADKYRKFYGSSFYAHGELGRTKIRFCFPKTDDVLQEAGERLLRLQA